MNRSHHEPGEASFPITTIDNSVVGNTAAHLIRGEEGIIDRLFHVDGLFNLLLEAVPASSTSAGVTEVEELRSEFQSRLRMLQELL